MASSIQHSTVFCFFMLDRRVYGVDAKAKSAFSFSAQTTYSVKYSYSFLVFAVLECLCTEGFCH